MEEIAFLDMMNDMLLAPDTIIRKEWVRSLLLLIEKKDAEIKRLRSDVIRLARY